MTIGAVGTKSWGLELAGCGIGQQQKLVEDAAREVSAVSRRLGYRWDDLVEDWYLRDVLMID